MCTQPGAVLVISLANNFLSLLFIDDKKAFQPGTLALPRLQRRPGYKGKHQPGRMKCGGKGPSQLSTRGGYAQGKSRISRSRNEDKSHRCIVSATRACPQRWRWPRHLVCPRYPLAMNGSTYPEPSIGECTGTTFCFLLSKCACADRRLPLM